MNALAHTSDCKPPEMEKSLSYTTPSIYFAIIPYRIGLHFVHTRYHSQRINYFRIGESHQQLFHTYCMFVRIKY